MSIITIGEFKENKIKSHFKKHKSKYVTGGICLAVGTIVGIGYGDHITNKLKSVSIIIGKDNTITNNLTNVTQVVRRGHAGNIIKRVGDGKEWSSQRQLCKELGIDGRDLWRHLKGQVDNINGDMFEKVGSFNADESH